MGNDDGIELPSQAVVGDQVPFQVHDLLDLVEKPGVDPGHPEDLLVRPAEIERTLDVEDPIGIRAEQLLPDARVVEIGAREAAHPGLEAPQPFCSASLKVRPIAITSPTDFIWVPSAGLASLNFSKAQRGILTTT